MAEAIIEAPNERLDQPFTRGSRQEFFDTKYLESDLKGRSVRGGAATVATQAAKFLIKFASVPIMARLLTPEDFGLVAMVTAVTGFVEMFKDAGLSTATVQRAEINHHQVSTLFWINVTISLALMLVLVCLAPGIAWFYGEPRLRWITIALAGTLLLGGLTIQHQALLRRQMRFGTLGVIQVASQTVGIIAAILAAISGAGYWAIVTMTAVSSSAALVMSWTGCGWRPGLPRRRSGVRNMLFFGANLTTSSFFLYLQRTSDAILLGWAWGAAPLGIYSKAYQLLLLPLSRVKTPISAVAVPTLSRLQSQPLRFRKYYCEAIAAVVTLSAPIVVFFYVSVDNLVLMVLGSQWCDVIPVFRALTPAALVFCTAVGPGWLLIATDRSKTLAAINFCVAVVLTAFFAMGLRNGPLGVATAHSIGLCIAAPMAMAIALRGSPVSIWDVLRAVRPPLLASTSAGFVATCASHLLPTSTAGFGLLRDLAVFWISYSGLLLLLPRSRESLMQLAEALWRRRAVQAT